jgi:acyl carrier protein
MNLDALRAELRKLIVSELNLQGRDPASIDDEAPLFGEGGLGLDSLDALQLAMSVEERFGVRIPEGEEARRIFRSVASLAEHILAHATSAPGGPAGGEPDAEAGQGPRRPARKGT